MWSVASGSLSSRRRSGRVLACASRACAIRRRRARLTYRDGDEAIVARALLEDRERLPIQTDDWELLLCTLEDELSWLPSEADPTSHPKLIESAVMPQGATELSFWLACRLPLTTALRIHLLSCTCPTKRLRDLVDAMRLLADPAGEYVKVRGKRIRGKLRVVWETAEASGCELAPPRPVVDWAHGGDIGVSRY